MLAVIQEYRAAILREVRFARARSRTLRRRISFHVDVDVSIFDVALVECEEHRRLACEAKAELWKRIRAGDIEDREDITSTEAIQCFEEWSHTE